MYRPFSGGTTGSVHISAADGVTCETLECAAAGSGFANSRRILSGIWVDRRRDLSRATWKTRNSRKKSGRKFRALWIYQRAIGAPNESVNGILDDITGKPVDEIAIHYVERAINARFEYRLFEPVTVHFI